MFEAISRERVLYFAALSIVFVIGVFLRLPPTLFNPGAPLHAVAGLHPNPKFDGIGFDEGLYREYVNTVSQVGLGGYPDIVDKYIEVQRKLPGSILPPLRFFYIFAGYIWHTLFGTEALAALHNVAALFSVLTLCLSALFAWRLRGPAWGLAVAALIAFAPTQIHMSQHALVDGFFTFWALCCLWLLWENLHAPRKVGWLIAYTLVLCCLVLTKENAFFVFVALVSILLFNRWLNFGTVTRELLVATVLGPLLGVVILVFLAGGFSTLITSYQLSISKNYQLTYAVLTGDGPWYRYLVDLLLVNPFILILALGAVFQLNRTQKPELFLGIFVGASYLVMCNIKYGMNLRYANMWDMPLCFLAFSQVGRLFSPVARYRTTIICLVVGLLCAYELRQYIVLFVRYPLYELVSEGLLRALKILKSQH